MVEEELRKKEETVKDRRVRAKKRELRAFLEKRDLRKDDLRKYTIDSVHDEGFRVLEARLKPDRRAELNADNIFKFENWIQVWGKREEPDDDLILPFEFSI